MRALIDQQRLSKDAADQRYTYVPQHWQPAPLATPSRGANRRKTWICPPGADSQMKIEPRAGDVKIMVGDLTDPPATLLQGAAVHRQSRRVVAAATSQVLHTASWVL